ncbi:unnamed protein product [Amoebophrya sp. A25]|nr:unnamed protein product [Amoebophrya sp. A25]|eukprot:GSA25T00019852001.1
MADQKHGHGREMWFEDKSVFVGEYRAGMKHGRGSYLWDDGSQYEGDFCNDIIEGKGVYKCAKSTYEGEFHASMQHGQGVQRWLDGRVYEGNFTENHRDGEGKMTWPDGHVYAGQWSRGQQHGKGVEGRAGNQTAVVYKNGVKTAKGGVAAATNKKATGGVRDGAKVGA